MTASQILPAQAAKQALEIKAATFSLPLIRLLDNALDQLALQVEEKIAQAPDLFLHTPVVIDLSGLPEDQEIGSFPELVGVLRAVGMMPIGLRGGNALQQQAAKAMELAILSETRPRAKPEQRHEEQEPPAAAIEAAAAMPSIEVGSKVIAHPVRSGQKVYTAGGDLTVIGPVNSGAELMADGNIHVYGPLRGRVFAGIKGNEQARIFCQHLHAELIAIAGQYRVSENIPSELKGARVQIFLDQETLKIERF